LKVEESHGRGTPRERRTVPSRQILQYGRGRAASGICDRAAKGIKDEVIPLGPEGRRKLFASDRISPQSLCGLHADQNRTMMQGIDQGASTGLDLGSHGAFSLEGSSC
jgi:hypothetical protein